MSSYITNDEPANKQEFGFDEKPPTVPELTNATPVNVGIRADGNAAAPAADAMSDDTVAVNDPSDQRNEMHQVSHLTDLSWGSNEGTTGLFGFWNGAGRAAAKNSDTSLGG